jgi:hypothetical protein
MIVSMDIILEEIRSDHRVWPTTWFDSRLHVGLDYVEVIFLWDQNVRRILMK